VVGPRQPTALPVVPPVVWTREEPAGGGPVAALAAGLAECDGASTVVVLAADLVGVTGGTVDRLRAELARRPDADGVVLVDQDGHRQWLIGAWRAAALTAALPVRPQGAALRAMLAGLTVATVPGLPGESADIDTPDDLATYQAAHGAGGPSRPSHW
jgi:molybdopterin-guanine dinucleotide biosynthesis protein A